MVVVDAELSVRISNFSRFIEAVFQFTISFFTDDMMQNHTETIVNMLRFWDLMARMVVKAKPDFDCKIYVKCMSQVIRSYVTLALEFIEANVEEARKIFFKDWSQIDPLMRQVTGIGKVDSEEFFQQVLEAFELRLGRFLSNPADSVSECGVAFLSCALMEPVADRSYSPTADSFSFVQKFALAILRLILETGKVLTHAKPAWIEQVVLFLIHYMRKTFMIQFAHHNPSAILKRGPDSFYDVNDILGLVFRRVMLSLRVFPDNEGIVSQAIGALHQLALGPTDEYRRNTRTVIRDVLISEHLDVSWREQLAFLNYPTNRRSRVKFYELISRLMWQDVAHPQLLRFREMLDQRIAEVAISPTESLAQGVLLDLRGLLQGAIIRFPYNSLFEWLYPDAVETLQKITVEFPSVQSYYLKFLLQFVSNNGSRIIFDPHSANGLRTFKTVASSLVSFYQSLATFRDSYSGVLRNPKCFTCSMKIMETILTNRSSNIGALEVYKDPALMDLLREFLIVARKVDLMQCLSLRKTMLALMRLLSCLFEKFRDKIVALDPDFLVVGLSIASSFEVERDDSDRCCDAILKIVNNVTKYFVKSGDEKLRESVGSTYERILKMLEEMVFRWSGGIYVQVTKVMSTVLLMRQKNWHEVRRKILLFLQFCVDKDLKQAIDDLTSQVWPEEAVT
jgi:hypothetical protein